MRAESIIRDVVGQCSEFLHAKTVEALLRFCTALLTGQKLTLTELGRSAPGAAKPKHRIKAANRFLGNRRLHAKLSDVYRVLAQRWLEHAPKYPVVLVDWTGLPKGFYSLSASVAFRGRSVPIYAEVYPESKKSNRRVEARFLRRLKYIVPSACQPTVVADAGFYTEWCDAVESQGWSFVVRVRDKTKYRAKDDSAWTPIKDLHEVASRKVRSLGWVWLTKTNARKRRVIYVRRRKTGRRSRVQSTNAKKCRARANEPWILSTNLHVAPKRVVEIYALRMQIEQNYRDLKDTRWGWCLEQARCKSAERFALLLLLATITIFSVLLLGFAAESKGVHRAHQANTSRSRVLSFFYLGNRLIKERSELPVAVLRSFIPLLAEAIYSVEPQTTRDGP